jgi:ATP-dependent phosphofructokinase / diphosphate-dependent phosphofructokinase
MKSLEYKAAFPHATLQSHVLIIDTQTLALEARLIRRIGILSGGGDCPGINAVIRAVTYSAIVSHGWEVIGIEDGYDGLLRKDGTRRLRIAQVRGILHQGGTILGTTNRSNPFAWVSDEAGQITVRDRSSDVLEAIKAEELDALVAIGGDGSLRIGQQFFDLGVPVVGVPKTIDNDLSCTDYTFGFHTAVEVATDALDRLHTTAESHHRVMILEVMGRDAGWIALESGIAGGAHAILIPEIPFDIDVLCSFIRYRERELRANHSVIVIAEGCEIPGEGQVLEPGTVPGAAARLSGICSWLAGQVTSRTGVETRATVLGHLQRGGAPNSVDRILATRFGAAAVDLLANERFGEMVAQRGQQIVSVPIRDAIGSVRNVPQDHQLVQQARQIGVSFGDQMPPSANRARRD